MMFAGQIAEVLAEQAAITRERYDAGLADIRELYAAERNAVDAQANLPQNRRGARGRRGTPLGAPRWLQCRS